MVSKIKIRMGQIEVDYEGSEAFLKEELPALLSAVSELYQRSQGDGSQGAAGGIDRVQRAQPADAAESPKLQGTTGMFAGRLQVKSGSDLVMAAACQLHFSAGLKSFPRKTIIDEMKSATSYFKTNYISNLSKILTSLVRLGKLNEPSKDTYALSAASVRELEAKIA